jgi:hypothetical protein
MANLEIQNPQFSNRSSESLISNFLQEKLEKASLATEGSESYVEKISPKKRFVLPNYSFVFG